MKLFLCLAAFVAAFTTQSDAATFRLIAVNCSLSDVFYEPSSGGKAVPLTIRKSPTKDYPNPTTPSLEIFRLIPPPPNSPPGTKPTKEIVASAKLGENESSLVILTQSGGDSFASFVVPDDAQTHPIGTLRVVNLSKHRIAVALDEDIVDLGGRTSKLMPIGTGKKVFKLRLAHNGAGDWDVFKNQSILFYPEVRSFAFIYDAPGSPNPEMKFRSERPPGFWTKPNPNL